MQKAFRTLVSVCQILMLPARINPEFVQNVEANLKLRSTAVLGWSMCVKNVAELQRVFQVGKPYVRVNIQEVLEKQFFRREIAELLTFLVGEGKSKAIFPTRNSRSGEPN